MDDIVVGVDRSDTAHRAAERAAELASAYGANLHLVMAIERAGSKQFAIGGDTFHIDPLSEAEDFLHDLARTLPHDRIDHSVPYGDPAKALCEAARRLGARAIVVGNRRVQGMSRVLGSVAGDVVKSAPCDVVIANTTAKPS